MKRGTDINPKSRGLKYGCEQSEISDETEYITYLVIKCYQLLYHKPVTDRREMKGSIYKENYKLLYHRFIL